LPAGRQGRIEDFDDAKLSAHSQHPLLLVHPLWKTPKQLIDLALKHTQFFVFSES
jgi:hypothetical protein